MNRLEKIALRIAAEKLLATNYSSFSYEYDANHVTAEVFLDEGSGRLTLKITEERVKTGLGAGRRSTVDEYPLGTIQKPKLSGVRTILKKRGHTRGRFSSPFSARWKTPQGNEEALGDIIRFEQSQMAPSSAPQQAQPQIRLVESEKRWLGLPVLKRVLGKAGRDGADREEIAARLQKALPTWFVYVGGHHIAVHPHSGSNERVALIQVED